MQVLGHSLAIFSGQDLALSQLQPWFQTLMGELRSHMQHLLMPLACWLEDFLKQKSFSVRHLCFVQWMKSGPSNKHTTCQLSSAGGSQMILVQSLSCIQHFATPQTAACQAPLSSTISQNLLKLRSIESGMPSNHLILCCSLLLPSVFPSIRVFSNALALHIR